MKRCLCVWLPLWPIQRFRGEQPEVRRRPLALYEPTSRGDRLTACSPAASRRGLRPGMSVDEAKIFSGPERPGREDGVLLAPGDPEVDQTALHELALECRRMFTPVVGIEEMERPECLLMDIHGCEHLFHSERELVNAVARRFAEHQLRVRCATAATIGTAWALAHYDRRNIVLSGPEEAQWRLNFLPLEALRLPATAIATLVELGVERVGQLLEFSRAELSVRFDPLVTRRLRQALGIEPELIVPIPEPEQLTSAWSSEEAVSDPAIIERLVSERMTALLARCGESGRGLLRLNCRLGTGAPPVEEYIVELTRPSLDAAYVLDLLRLQWERRAIPETVSEIVLEAERIAGRSRSSGLLFEDFQIARTQASLRQLVDRLSSRLEKNCVLRALLSADAQPEFAVTYEPWIDGAASRNKIVTTETTWRALRWERPLMLVEPRKAEIWATVPDGPPQRAKWRGEFQKVVRYWGPERIEMGWWRGAIAHRDYYRIELESGEWLWVFRDRTNESGTKWNLHGVFG